MKKSNSIKIILVMTLANFLINISPIKCNRVSSKIFSGGNRKQLIIIAKLQNSVKTCPNPLATIFINISVILYLFLIILLKNRTKNF